MDAITGTIDRVIMLLTCIMPHCKSDSSPFFGLCTKDEFEYKMKIEHEVILFTLETQSSKKLSSNGVLLSIE